MAKHLNLCAIKTLIFDQCDTVMKKPYSQACENNKQPILAMLNDAFANTKHVLEIGSGSGQHAVYCSAYLPHLTWQTSDLICNHPGINQWLDEADLANLNRPIALDLNNTWPIKSTDGIFTANTLHIVSWELVVKFFEGVSNHLSTNGVLCIYGPFNYHNQFTSQSNANFDLWLKSRDSLSGIRDIEAIIQLASQAQLKLQQDHQMPANNRLLVFGKTI